MVHVTGEVPGAAPEPLQFVHGDGLVTPQRTSGGGRRYTKRDVALLREIQRLSQEDGVNLAGIKAIIDLTERVDSLEQENAELREQLYQAKAQARRSRGELVHVPRSTAVVMWEPRTRRRHKDNRGGER